MNSYPPQKGNDKDDLLKPPPPPLPPPPMMKPPQPAPVNSRPGISSTSTLPPPPPALPINHRNTTTVALGPGDTDNNGTKQQKQHHEKKGNKKNNQQQPPPPHEMNENIPKFDSAPPSGNVPPDFFQQQQQQQEQETKKNLAAAFFDQQQPPAPPPPPPTVQPSLSQQAVRPPNRVPSLGQPPPPPPPALPSRALKTTLPPPPPMPTTAKSSTTATTVPLAQPPPIPTGTQASTAASSVVSATSPPVTQPAAIATPISSSLQTPTIATQPPSSSLPQQPAPPPPPPPPPPPAQRREEQQHQQVVQEQQQQQQQQQQPLSSAATYPPNPQQPEPLPARLSPSMALNPFAKRQTHLPILILSTEEANNIAYKNNLTLCQMLEGLSTPQQLEPVTKNHILPPFRSASRSIALNWNAIQISYITGDLYNKCMSSSTEETNKGKDLFNQELYDAARIHNTDGNILEELNLLENQIDSMLHDDKDRDDDIRREGKSKSSKGESFSNVDYIRQRSMQLEEITRDAFSLTSPPNLPWLLRFRHTLDTDTDGLCTHDLLSTPSLVLVVCSSNETTESPIDCINELFSSPHYLPAPYAKHLFDIKNLRRVALILHDNVDGPADFVQNETYIKQQLQSRFGTESNILKINSVLPSTAAQIAKEESSDIWGGNGNRGCCLSMSDRLSLKCYVATLIDKALIPSLERRIADLNTIVTAQKKGVKNLFKVFTRKPKGSSESAASDLSMLTSSLLSPASYGASTTTNTSNSNNPNNHVYTHDKIESQVRLLGDTLFLMRDYDAALSTYRLIKDDYKADRAIMHYASIHEMMALCLYCLDPVDRAKEIFSNIETALFSYTRAAEDETMFLMKQNKKQPSLPTGRPTRVPMATRLATRLCLILSSTRNMTSGRHLEVADLLASASSHETSLGAAVLLEQSSSHYYGAGMYRKYAFHMLMAGHMFRSAGQDQHAFRCFTAALYVYHDGRWDELHNHLRSALAAQLYSLGRYAVSLQLYAKLVGTTGGGRVSVKSQEKFVNHLLDICQQYTDKALDGADRMINVDYSKADDSGFDERNARNKRINDVLSSTAQAKRILEVPNMDLPRIDDTSISVSIVDKDTKGDGNNTATSPSSPVLFGTPAVGQESIWEDLICSTEAELRIADTSHPKPDVSKLSPAMAQSLAKIDDESIRHVITELDKERAKLAMESRSKKSDSYKEHPKARAKCEPLSISFIISNPLSLQIQLLELQLVARLKEEKTGRVCTSEDAIDVGGNSSKQWKFHSSKSSFHSPTFARTSSPPLDDRQEKGPWTSCENNEPYFVVTKDNLTLDAGSQSEINLGICPLVTGDLEILGVRCRLFNNVWVYHGFQVKGRLLNNTRMNRASRARAQSMLLLAKIKEDMPRLTAEIVPRNSSWNQGEGPVLRGQVTSCILRLKNVGTAAASNITLKTNTPWINITSVDQTAQKIDGSRATSNCIGPSGTLMRIPFEGSREDSVLHSGESIDIPVVIKASGDGKREFYMLYRYELWDPSSKVKRSRYLRKMLDVPVFPSLTATVSLIPSSWVKNEHILSMEITNQRTDRPDNLMVTMDKLSLVSREYAIEMLPGQISDDENHKKPLQIGWQERVTMHYRVIPRNTTNTAGSGHLLSECPFKEGSNSENNSSPSGNIAYLCLENAHKKFQSALDSHQRELARITSEEEDNGGPRSISSIRRANTSLSESASEYSSGGLATESAGEEKCTDAPTSINKLCPADMSMSKVHIICSWSTAGGGGRTDTVYGQHYLADLTVRPKVRSKGCPIMITAKYPSSVYHDFNKGHVNVPIEITLVNRLVSASVDFEFSIDRPKMFEFVGAESFGWKLECSDELTIPLQAVIPSPGLYNMQHVRLRITSEGMMNIPFVFPLQWMVTVNDVSRPVET